MPGKAEAPLDMLKRIRGHFAKEAENYAIAERKASTVWERNVATEFGSTARKFVSDIDATLRDWA